VAAYAAEDDALIRASVSAWLDQSENPYGGYSWQQLQTGFRFRGERMALITQTGIRKLPGPSGAALAIVTTYTPEGQDAPYDDAVGEDGWFHYQYRTGAGGAAAFNQGLRLAFEQGLPLVWFVGVDRGVYAALRPVYVVGDEVAAGEFLLDISPAQPDVTTPPEPGEPRASYARRLTRYRLHQPGFRARVLRAYTHGCSLCSLRYPALLDAAHIRSDAAGGKPVVPNGLALCKIHRPAFDAGILGVRPDLVAQVRPDVLHEVDGPMLRHGLQEVHGQALLVPHRQAHRPATDALEERWAAFLAR